MKATWTLAWVAVVLLSACAHRAPSDRPPPVYSPARHAPVAHYGRVTHIDRVVSRGSETTGSGAIVGGVIGAVVGRQIADRDHKAAGTLIGGVAGAVIGNEIEKDQRGPRSVVRVTIRLDGGALRYFDFAHIGDLRVGDRVRVEGDRVYRL